MGCPASLIKEVRMGKQHYEKTGLQLTQEELENWLEKVKAGEDTPMPEVHTCT